MIGGTLESVTIDGRTICVDDAGIIRPPVVAGYITSVKGRRATISVNLSDQAAIDAFIAAATDPKRKWEAAKRARAQRRRQRRGRR